MSKDLSVDILSDITTYMKYAKYLPKKNRRETFGEMVTRNKAMHIKKFPELKDEINSTYKLVSAKKVLPSMRSMQFAGKAIEVNPTRLFNCAFLAIDDYRAFNETMFLLLSGCGVGYSVQSHHAEQLPEIVKPNSDRTRRFLIGDSIEGWADSVKALVRQYYVGGSKIRFDYSDIREKGALLVTSGGKAPGPQPLRECLVKIEGIFESKPVGSKLTTIEVHDIMCHIADAVLAGGIRRCLPSNYLVCVGPDQYKEISEMSRGDSVYYDERYYEVKNNFEQGEQDIVKLTTAEGYHLSTPNHRWLVLDKKSEKIIWTTASDISKDPTRYSFAKEKYDFVDILRVEDFGSEETYDIEVDEVHCFTAKNPSTGLESVSHNSAMIALFDADDEEMLAAKAGNWWETNPQRGRANNSVVVLRHKIEKDFFLNLLKRTEMSRAGEPGIVLSNDKELGTNPCGEIALRSMQFCNLVEVNVSDIEDQADLEARVTAATLIGTLQASYTDFHYLRAKWQRNTEKDALVGVSMTGIASGAVLSEDIDLAKAAEVAKAENARVAELLNTNPAARLTTVKPSGCLSADTEIRTNLGNIKLSTIFDANGYTESIIKRSAGEFLPANEKIYVYNEKNEKELITKLFVNGLADTYEIELDDGTTVSATKEHRFLTTNRGWVKAADLDLDDDILSY